MTFDPRKIPGLIAWYDRNDPVTVIDNDTGKVSRVLFNKAVGFKTTGIVTGSIKINGKDITNKRALPHDK